MPTNPEELFLEAQQSYETIMVNLKEIYKILPLKAKTSLFKGHFGNMKMGFDLLLQNTLLKIATADGTVAPNETAFLARLGDLGYDLCDYVNAFAKSAKKKVKVEWSFFEKAPALEVRAIADVIDLATDSSSSNFFKAFGLVDLATNKDYFIILEDAVYVIADDFLAIDGDRSEKENNAALLEIKNSILKPIVQTNAVLLNALIKK